MISDTATTNFFPHTGVEYVNALAHYYRAEMQRAISWRDRLDRTTNWAIAASAGILSVSLNQPEKHHGLLIFAMAVVFMLLVIESRRYCYFDVYRRRVRQFESNYYPVVFMASGAGATDTAWLRELGGDLRTPVVSLTYLEAMAHRLRRNYCWIFLILLAAWLLKVIGSVAFMQIWETPSDLHLRAEVGWTPGWAVLLGVLLFHAWLLYVMVRYGKATHDSSLREV